MRAPLLAASLLLACLFAVLAGPSSAQAAQLQTIGNFTEPMYVTSPPKEPNRLLVAERSGKIMEVRGGRTLRFADLREIVDCCYEDRGMQSIALAPDFATTGRMYVDYTDAGDNIHIAELTANAKTHTAPLRTLREVLTVPYEPDANHLGGQIAFGPDGYLYISTGDGGYGGRNDEHHNAQNLMRLQGKLLRIDPKPSGVLPYTVPASNPFASAPAPFDTIWSYGLRNPYRFSFDPPSNSIVLPDVGENEREEVDILKVAASRGANFGWNCREGGIPGPATDPECAGLPASAFVNPVFEYGHKNDGGAWGCAIIGGFIVRDRSLADLYGRFLYADFCTAAVRSFDPANPYGTDRSENISVGEATSFGEDSCGRVYVMSRAGTVSRFVGAKPDPCLLAAKVSLAAASSAVRAGARAALTVRVTPCADRKRGQNVALYASGKRVAKSRLSRSCVARFHPRVFRRTSFRARVGAEVTYRAAGSRPVTVDVLAAR